MNIIVLSEHVDYWNRLGWTDPFSSSQYSKRQGEYANAFHLNSVYTPQAVVNGAKEFVGSESEAVTTAISNAARKPGATVTLSVDKSKPETVSLNVKIVGVPSSKGVSDVMLAITEDNLHSNVSRGENSGSMLEHTGVVRQLTKIGTVQGNSFTANPSIILKSQWKRDNLNAVVFVQQRENLHILGAGIISLPPNPQ